MKRTTDHTLQDTKEFKALAKAIGESEARELVSRDEDALKALIAAHTVSMDQATAETKSAPAYVSAVEIKKDFDKALREQIKPLKLAVKMAAKTLNSRK